MNEFDEGLGTVYERLIMNGMFDKLVDKYMLRSILEVPIYGMTGLTGINSVEFERKSCQVALADTASNLDKACKLWEVLGKSCSFVPITDFTDLPFKDGLFDLVWNFAALWHVKDAPALVAEMARVSSRLVWISVQNTTQPGHMLRKYVIAKELFSTIHEEWLNTHMICGVLERSGMRVIQQGIFDIPPFPDVAMPIGRKVSNGWSWNVMDYYMNKDPQLPERISKYRIIEDSGLPTTLKGLWAHHRYILAEKK